MLSIEKSDLTRKRSKEIVSITRTRPREYELPEEDLDEGFDMTVSYISINGKNKGIPTAIPGIDADDVSYSPSTSERRGSGGKATMKVVAPPS
jgi:hypothetical protein